MFLFNGGAGEGKRWGVRGPRRGRRRRNKVGGIGERREGLLGDVPDREYISTLCFAVLNLHDYSQLHVNEEHPDKPLLEHVRELIRKLDSLGVKPSPAAEVDARDDGEGWEDEASEEEDDDVEME